MTRYQIALKAEYLSRGCFGRPSPFAVVHYDEKGPYKGMRIGKTETIEGTRDPDFVRVLFFEADPGQITRVKITFYDNRGPQQEDDVLGEVMVEATEVFQDKGHSQTHSLERGKARVHVSITESNPTHAGTVHFHLRGLDIRNVEPGLLGLGRSDPFFEVAKKDADHSTGQIQWNVVYRSEYLDNHLNPYWEPFEIGLEELCNGDWDHPIRISVKDHNRRVKHKFIGAVETNLRHLQDRVAIKGNADRDRAFDLYQDNDPDTHGLICVLKAEVVGTA